MSRYAMEQPADLDQTCPLCGCHNSCAMAMGKSAEACWCQSASIDPEALAAIPEASLGKHCICAKCAAGAVARDSAVTDHDG